MSQCLWVSVPSVSEKEVVYEIAAPFSENSTPSIGELLEAVSKKHLQTSGVEIVAAHLCAVDNDGKEIESLVDYEIKPDDPVRAVYTRDALVSFGINELRSMAVREGIKAKGTKQHLIEAIFAAQRHQTGDFDENEQDSQVVEDQEAELIEHLAAMVISPTEDDKPALTTEPESEPVQSEPEPMEPKEEPPTISPAMEESEVSGGDETAEPSVEAIDTPDATTNTNENDSDSEELDSEFTFAQLRLMVNNLKDRATKMLSRDELKLLATRFRDAKASPIKHAPPSPSSSTTSSHHLATGSPQSSRIAPTRTGQVRPLSPKPVPQQRPLSPKPAPQQRPLSPKPTPQQRPISPKQRPMSPKGQNTTTAALPPAVLRSSQSTMVVGSAATKPAPSRPRSPVPPPSSAKAPPSRPGSSDSTASRTASRPGSSDSSKDQKMLTTTKPRPVPRQMSTPVSPSQPAPTPTSASKPPARPRSPVPPTSAQAPVNRPSSSVDAKPERPRSPKPAGTQIRPRSPRPASSIAPVTDHEKARPAFNRLASTRGPVIPVRGGSAGDTQIQPIRSNSPKPSARRNSIDSPGSVVSDTARDERFAFNKSRSSNSVGDATDLLAGLNLDPTPDALEVVISNKPFSGQTGIPAVRRGSHNSNSTDNSVDSKLSGTRSLDSLQDPEHGVKRSTASVIRGTKPSPGRSAAKPTTATRNPAPNSSVPRSTSQPKINLGVNSATAAKPSAVPSKPVSHAAAGPHARPVRSISQPDIRHQPLVAKPIPPTPAADAEPEPLPEVFRQINASNSHSAVKPSVAAKPIANQAPAAEMRAAPVIATESKRAVVPDAPKPTPTDNLAPSSGRSIITDAHPFAKILDKSSSPTL